MKKKCLVVSGYLRVGGLERVAVNCMRYSDLDKYQFDFLVFDKQRGELETEVEMLGGRVLRTTHPKNIINYYRNIIQIMKKNGPYDIVHSHIFFNSGLIMLAAYICRIPIRIAHAHSIKRKGAGVPKILFNNLMRFFLDSFSTHICACSAAAGNYVFGIKDFSKRGIIIPNIVDIKKMTYSEEARKNIRKNLGIAENEIVIGQVGHLAPVKNNLYMLDILKEYISDTPAKLLLVGDGVMRNQIWDRINKFGLQEYVIMTGTRTDIGALMSAMDVFVSTSTNEGFGIVLLEAQVNGLRCVAENNAIVDEIKELGNCTFVDGFMHVSKWVSAIKGAVAKGRLVDKELKVVLESPYTEAGLRNAVSKIYS